MSEKNKCSNGFCNFITQNKILTVREELILFLKTYHRTYLFYSANNMLAETEKFEVNYRIIEELVKIGTLFRSFLKQFVSVKTKDMNTE